ncbi:hypothetical protein AVEN_26352-1 [Araneus ventricosus]|uniref:Uncharacterized protein n=1 Tax=Araneus ventricosus TaxID=182803 RepID=A0A4Y2TN99_ARAVE|nr:hypothetical protein AVEN_26352-1 [Araneus ventricosus]
MERTTPGLAPPPNFRTPPARGHLTPTYDSTCNKPNTKRIFTGMVFRTWNPGTEVETLPLVLRGPPGSGTVDMSLISESKSYFCSLKALFQRRVVWPNFESLEWTVAFVDCGWWNSNRRAAPTARGFANIWEVLECTDTMAPSGLFDVRAIYCYNAGNHRRIYKPTNHIDSSRSDDRE